MAWTDIISAIKPTVAQWTAFFNHIKDLALEDLALSDSTTNNATTLKHGLMPKLDGQTTHFMRSDGMQAVPAGVGIGLGGATGATDGAILLADGVSTDTIKTSSITIVTTLGADDTTVPTSKAVKDVTDGKIPKTTNITALNETGIADGEICVFNPTNKDIRTSDRTIVTTLGSDDTTVPTSKAVKDVADGKLLITTANSPKRSIFLSCVGGWLPTTSPAGAVTKTETSTNKVNFNGALFAAGASDIYKEFGMPMPANYDGGTVTAIPYIFVPTSTDASSHTIKLSLAGVSFSSGDAGDAAYGTKQESTITAAASLAGKVVVGAATSAITIAGTPIGADWIQWRVGRTGDDTYTGDITLLGWLISYSTDAYSDV